MALSVVVTFVTNPNILGLVTNVTTIDILEPLHYLTLLEQRPGAFEHAQPLLRWTPGWRAGFAALNCDLRA